MGKSLTLFGGDKCWDEDQWVASDDRVRGGKSQSYLSCSDDVARFHGTLDIETLGGAGFASQRTASDDLKLDLSEYAGIQLAISKADKKRYTFIIKDDLLPPDEKSGREQATISWECDFSIPPEDEPDDSCNQSVFIPWDAFLPTYRGKPKKDAKDLDLKNIKRFSVMMRSFFGQQDGDFSLSIRSISALCETPESLQRSGDTKHIDIRGLEDGYRGPVITEQDRHVFSSRCLTALHSAGCRKVAFAIIGSVILCALYYYVGDRRL